MLVRRRSRRIKGALAVLAGGFLVLALLPGEGEPTIPPYSAPGDGPRIALAENRAPLRPAPTNAASHEATSPITPRMVRTAALDKDVTSAPDLTEAAAVAPVAAPEVAGQPATARDGVMGRIGDVAVNVHAGPSNGADKLFVAQPGEQVELVEQQGGWVHITAGDGQSGWVYSRFLANSG